MFILDFDLLSTEILMKRLVEIVNFTIFWSILTTVKELLEMGNLIKSEIDRSGMVLPQAEWQHSKPDSISEGANSAFSYACAFPLTSRRLCSVTRT